MATPASLRRENQALELRRAGLTFDAIAERLGYKTRDGAHKAWQRAIKRASTSGTREEFVALELDRLERLHAAFWSKALRGDRDAAQMTVRISERREVLMSTLAANSGADSREEASRADEIAERRRARRHADAASTSRTTGSV